MNQQLGKYRILQRIGQGGMGAVFKAYDPLLDRVVAIKVISANLDVTPKLRARFLREAQACARLNHPNIVTVHDLAEIDGQLLIVMEFLDGEELRQLITERRPIPLERKIDLMIKVCDGLTYAHRAGVVHLDVKPANIFILRDGGVKLLDFGVARILDSDPDLTRTGSFMGTLRYMAPEQARGRGDHRADVFSAAAAFYEFLSYRRAFPGDDPIEVLEAVRSHEPTRLDELDPTIPGELGATMSLAMRKDPAARLGDLAEMREALSAAGQRLTSDTERRRRSLQDRMERARQLTTRVAEMLGQPPDDETLPVVDERADLATITVMEQHVIRRIERLQTVLANVSGVEPTVQRGLERIRAGVYGEAIADLRPVVDAFPRHLRASGALDEARRGQEGQRGTEAERTSLAHAHEEADESTEIGASLEELTVVSSPATVPPARRPRSPRHVRIRALAAVGGAAVVIGAGTYLLWTPNQPNPDQIATPAPVIPEVTPPTKARPVEPAPLLSPSASSPPSAPLPKKPPSAALESRVVPDKAAERAESREREKANVEQLRAQSSTAREEAEHADGDRHAPSQMAAGRAKVAEAQAALDRQDYAKAGDQFREADRVFKAAAQDARRRTLQADVEKVRLDVITRRDRATKADAGTLARDALEAARAREREGEAFVLAGDYPAARHSYEGAGGHYDDAARRAVGLGAARNHANDERNRMEEQKRRAHQTSSYFADASRLEQEAGVMYERLRFQEASDRFRGAGALYARALPPSPVAPQTPVTPPNPVTPPSAAAPKPLGPFGADVSPDIRRVLEDLKRAYESKDLALLQEIRPGLRSDELRSMRDTFDNATSYKLDLRVEAIQIKGNDAEARAFRQDVMIAKDGQIYRNEARVTVTLKRVQNRWTIHDIK